MTHPTPGDTRAAIGRTLRAAVPANPEGLTLPVIKAIAAQVGVPIGEALGMLGADRAFEMCFEAEDGTPVPPAEIAERLRAEDRAWCERVYVFWRFTGDPAS